MDYPETEDFIAEISHEVREQIQRLAARPCVAVLCGNSEGEQQAAMFGATRERWSPGLFHQVIPALLDSLHCEIAYWPSSAHGGAFPHQNDAGTTSYYGVGAYLRPLTDARSSNMRFATECLAFANVADESSIRKMPNGLALKTHHPQWKSRTPRDLGAGWDFEDVRDHYLRLLFNVDPMQLRYADHDRYLELSRVLSGEVMAATFNEWRSNNSSCQGGLIWFLRDLWHGAGWGILDSDGVPKAAYHFVRRALQPVNVSISDEGCNGLYIHMINDSSHTFTGRLDVAWYQHSETLVNKASLDIQLLPHSQRKLPVLQLLEYFTDLNHAYRFGPALCDLVVATMSDTDASPASDAFHWPQGLSTHQHANLGLRAQATLLANGDALLTIRSDKLAQALCVTIDGYACDDQYCHIAPAGQRSIYLTRIDPTAKLKGEVKALNGTQRIAIDVIV